MHRLAYANHISSKQTLRKSCHKGGDVAPVTDQILVEHCASTLAGLKTAGLVNVAFDSRDCANCEVCRLNRMLAERGVRVIPLCYRKDRALLYVYRPSMLQKDLENKLARRILEQMGYSFCHADLGVALLAKRMKTNDKFPHEIGLFLGYPPEDVNGFIHHRDTGCKCVGDWRVYGDVAKAKETFARYKKCKEVYKRLFREGRSVESLTVKQSA